MVDNVEELSLQDLKAELKKRGLKATGRKGVLQKRLQEALDEEEAGDELDPSSMSVAELKAALKERGLKATGKRSVLEERLTEALGDGEEKEEDEEEEEEEPPKKKKQKMADGLKKSTSKKRASHKVDKCAPNSFTEVVEDFNCMLNQTNITGGRNNNKFYVIQVLRAPASNFYICFTRWGRVGEDGKTQQKGGSKDQAIKEFRSKFKAKTKNDWDNRDNFVKYNNKYELIEMAAEDEEAEMMAADVQSALGALDEEEVERKTAPSTLDGTTQSLINLLFDLNMFKSAMQSYDIDIKKMPLGAISKNQIRRGFEVLEEIQKLLKTGSHTNKIAQLSADFYTKIPHAMGRQRLPILNDAEAVQKKMDMLNVLGDIEIAQGLLKDTASKDKKKRKSEIKPNPIDLKYNTLNSDLELVKPGSKDFKVIDTYLKNTGTRGGWRSVKRIMNVWKVNRHNEDERFAVHEEIDNRKLLWHGTNVAVVVAILKSGLRIMPHSGGRVGRGIYFASENAKSAGYVGTTSSGGKTIGIMFLNEVCLGREHHIKSDDHTLRKAPNGYDCVIAQGQQEPEPSGDQSLTIDGREIVVPTGKPVKRSKWSASTFYQTEYLIYKESQNRIRFLLQCEFS